MMKSQFLLTAITCMGLTGGAIAAAPEAPSIGVVNFATCITDSKLGKQEQQSFEALKKQMSSLLMDTEKQINDLAAKFNDAEFLDGLSPEAEEELKVKFRTLNEEMSRYQNQYYQVLQQANMKLVQVMSANINTAAEKIAKDKKIGMVVNKEAFFYFTPQLDVTTAVISEMDKIFDLDAKKQPATASTAPANNAAVVPAKNNAAPAPSSATAPAKNNIAEATNASSPSTKNNETKTK